MTKKSLHVVWFAVLGLVLLSSFTGASPDPWLEIAAEQAQVIYDHFAAEEFAAIYAAMAPDIQGSMSLEEYVDYQERHFQRLRLRITEIEVGNPRIRASLPRSLTTVTSVDSYQYVISVPVSYRASFLVMRMRHEESLDKDVYFGVKETDDGEEKLVLLWDPAALEEDESDGEQ